MSKFLREVDSSTILQEAFSIVEKARHTIRVTMDASEELEKPLPREYFLLLKKKLAEGVKITRLGFGSRKDFDKLSNCISFEHKNYTFVYAGENPYRRMLVVDDKYMLFRKKQGGIKKFFYTDDSGHLLESKKYFFEITNEV